HGLAGGNLRRIRKRHMVNGRFGLAHAGGVFHHSHVMIFLLARQIMCFFTCYFYLALEIIGQAPKAAAGGRCSNHNSSSVCTSQWLIFSNRSSSNFFPEFTALAIWLML